MDYKKLTQQLERIVEKRTPQYISINRPEADEKLMKAHLLLAKIYGNDGHKQEAKKHLIEARMEFSHLCSMESNKNQYITNSKEGWEKFQAQERATDKKLRNYQHRIADTAQKIGLESSDLFDFLFIYSGRSSKNNIEKIIKDVYV